MTARTSIDGLFFNPASLANFGRDELIVHHANTLQGEGQNIALSYVHDVRVWRATFALTGVLVDLGEIEQTDENGLPLGNLAASEKHLHLTFATPIARGLRGGFTFTVYNISVDKSATSWLIDGGLQYSVPRVRGLELGASLMHAGPGLQVINAAQRDPTPRRLRFGAAYELGHVFLRDSAVSFWLSGDMVGRLRTFGGDTATADSIRGRASGWAPAFNVGAELAFDQTIFFRAGYAMSGDNLAAGGGGIGIGIRLKRFTFAVGQSFGTTQEGEPFQISFGYTF